MLRLDEAVEVVGEGPCQAQQGLVFALGVAQQLDLGLQLQVDGPRATPKALRQQLFGTLSGCPREEQRTGWLSGKGLLPSSLA